MRLRLFLIFILFLTPFFTTQVFAAACTDITADDANTTISADCTDLDISGDDTTTIINSGVTVSTVNSSTDDALAYTGGNSGIITNNGTINSLDDYALVNESNGIITTITNSGTISADDDYGLRNHGTITTIDNTGNIKALGDDYGIRNSGTITTLDNSGTISAANDYGIYSTGTITTFTNSGTISAADDYGIRNSGTITTLDNSGTISAANEFGIRNFGTITTLDNSDTISAVSHYGIRNAGTITTLDNSGTISAGSNYGIYHTGTITTLTNSGTFSAEDYGIYSTGTITTLTNSGTFSAADDYGIYNVNNNTITTFTNSGTISAADDYGLRNSGTITTFTNSGTISAADKHGLNNSGPITTLTNTGTISAGGNYGIATSGNITTLDNSGTISAGSNYGIYTTETITTLTNSGTISAVDDKAIFNEGLITTLTNTGTISAGGNYGIYNYWIEHMSGNQLARITTLNNSQGASSSALDYAGALPTNYNIIINSTSDYGKLNVSSTDLSGTTNFGIYSSSTIDDSYYSSVITGLTSSYINNDSGSTTINGTTYTWNLKNASGTIWDLYVATDTSTNLSLTTEFAPTLRTAFNYADTMSFVHSNYDCDTFGEDWCFSIGGRGTKITNDNTSQGSPALLLGKKLNDQYRLVLFYDHNYDYFHSKNITVEKQQPIIGGSLVWNQKDNHSGYEMKLSHAFQEQKLLLTRPKVGASFKGTGETLMTAYDTAAEIKYNYQRNTLTLSPYGVLRYSNKNINSFTETTADYPLTYNDISDETLTLLAGIKFIKPLTNTLNLKGSFAVNHNIRHSIDNLTPTGLNGLQTIDLEDDYNATLPIASLGLEYSISNNQSVTSTIQHRELSYQSMSETNIYVQYAFAF